MSVPTATAKPLSGAPIVVPANSLQLTRSGRYLLLIYRENPETRFAPKHDFVTSMKLPLENS
jgi:hypothetical protein